MLIQRKLNKMVEIHKRNATITDFLKLKNTYPTHDWRQNVGKALNFLMLFGASYQTLAGRLKLSGFNYKMAAFLVNTLLSGKVDWTPKNMEVNDYISEAKVIQAECGGAFDEVSVKANETLIYNIDAAFMSDSFFNSYKGLKSRIDRERDFALKHKYIRDWHGTVRWLPELQWLHLSPSWKSGNKNDGNKVAHLKNIAANTSVQTAECVPVDQTWILIDKYLTKWNFRSRIWNSIHDSLDVYCHKPEYHVVCALIEFASCMHRQPCPKIYMRMDITVSDMTTPEKREHDYYKTGIELKQKQLMHLQDALDEYNAKFGTHISIDEEDWKKPHEWE